MSRLVTKRYCRLDPSWEKALPISLVATAVRIVLGWGNNLLEERELVDVCVYGLLHGANAIKSMIEKVIVRRRMSRSYLGALSHRNRVIYCHPISSDLNITNRHESSRIGNELSRICGHSAAHTFSYVPPQLQTRKLTSWRYAGGLIMS